MTTFRAFDGTRLAYHRTGDGDGDPVICLPGGAMRASAYLGDLGGLPDRRPLVLLDLRGTGDSAVPADPTSYRCDRVVDDVEALRAHLGLDRIDVLGHSAGANLAVGYASRFPDRVRRLALVAPSSRALGVEVSDADRRELAGLRRDELWFDTAFASFERIWSGNDSEEDFDAITPFVYGRWDEAAKSHAAAEGSQRNETARGIFNSAEAFDPPATLAALAGLSAPVLVLAGEYDVMLPPRAAAAYAELLPRAEFVVQPGAGHYLWLDDPARFAATVAAFFDA